MDHCRPMLIAGQLETSEETLAVASPFDGRPLGEVAMASPAQVERALLAAEQARPLMAALPLHERATILTRLAGDLARMREPLAEGISAEAGKPIRQARAEVDRAVDTFTECAVAARTLDGDLLPMDAYAPGAGKLGLVRPAPVGPVVAITPFNFPLNLVAHKLGPAIAAGCPVLLKPSPRTPLTALALAHAALEAGLPPSALSVLPGGADVARALVADPRPRMLSFTGSAAVGWALRAQAGTKKVALELGGNAGAIVEPDCDVERAARRLALGAFAFAGQTCIKVQRISVHADVEERFREAFLAATAETPVGDPALEATVCGPVIDDDAATRIVSWIDEARAAGARVLAEPARDGTVLRPTVLEGVDRHARIWREEVFGPAVCLSVHVDLDQALYAIGDGTYGLQASLFTRDLAKVTRAWSELEVGAVIHDDFTNYRVDHMPYGGVRASGLGREGPRYAVREMTEPRLLVLGPGGIP